MKNYGFVLAILSVYLLLVARAWPFTWDDSGITLAFSRNLARYGEISPTPLTSRVEGYSAFLWMIINAGLFRAGLDQVSVLTYAKSMATILSITNILLLWKLIKSIIQTTVFQVACLVLFAINSYTIAAAADGMETSLYAFLVIISFLLFKKRYAGRLNYALFGIVSSLLILIRHEGFLFLIPFFLLILRERGKNILKEPVVYTWAVIFFGYQTWHYSYFGEFLTNPMLAKRFWPYKIEFETPLYFFIYYLSPLVDFAYRYVGVLFLLITYFISEKKFHKANLAKENDELIILIIGVTIIIMTITGANWRAAGRLSYPGLAFILLYLFARMDNPGLIISSRFFQFSAIICSVINLIVVIQSILPLNPDIITLAGVERRASSIDVVQRVLQRPTITFAGVDMGGLLLFHGDGKKIIDLALLCDRELGKFGYAQLDTSVFKTSNPEIIEAHGNWLQPLNNSLLFKSTYIPVMVLTDRNDEILYFRKDIFHELEMKFVMPVSNASAGYNDIDQPTLEKLGSFPVLNLKSYP